MGRHNSSHPISFSYDLLRMVQGQQRFVSPSSFVGPPPLRLLRPAPFTRMRVDHQKFPLFGEAVEYS